MHALVRTFGLVVVWGAFVAPSLAAAQSAQGTFPGGVGLWTVPQAVPVLAVGDTIDPPPEGPALEARGEVHDVTPGGAFLRSLVLPGWGHAATGSHLRGGFYVAAQSGAMWMLSKSMAAHREARRFRAEEIRAARHRLQASGIVQPDSLRILAESDPRVEEWDELIDARSEQVEDWVAAGVFILLLSATDAFVAGHLMDRPEPLTIQLGPTSPGRWELSVGVPWSPRLDPR